MVEKLVEIGILFDFYGKLLTEKQYSIVEMFYIEDFSLSEIGEEINITRQGVYDTLKRAEEKLYQYENTLGLVSKFRDSYINIKKILELTKDIKNSIEKEDYVKTINSANLIEDIGLEIIENSWEVID
ncbi:MAG: YlxM family DNA-binding protein [Tissierellaceae bacterium]|nr:YlxM family DNA-binding protein [Tissierellaceae bacterium]